MRLQGATIMNWPSDSTGSRRTPCKSLIVLPERQAGR